MYFKSFLTLIIPVSLLLSCQNTRKKNGQTSGKAHKTIQKNDSGKNLRYPGEKHLKNIRQLTFGGDNAEAYFSFNNQKIVFQSNYSGWDVNCDHIFYFNLEQGNMKQKDPPMISNGNGRTTCAYFLPGDSLVLYASTHQHQKNCPEPPPRRKHGAYVWPIYDNYDIFVASLNGKILHQLTNHPGYDAEATVSPNGGKIVFTSDRSGDLELWTMNIDGSNKQQITDDLGYDGGAFFSPNGEKLVFRASRPKTDKEVAQYKALLNKNLVSPTEMEIYTCHVDGSELKQVTELGKANWAPFFHPSGEKIIFSSNYKYEKGFHFNLFMTGLDGSKVEQITYDKEFDAFPMFSFDGKHLIFSSNRNNGNTRNTNIFIAEWVE